MKRLVTNFKIEQLLLAVVWMRGGEKYSHREGTSKEKRSGGGDKNRR